MWDYLDINITMTLQVTTMVRPNPPPKVTTSQTQWSPELIPAARARGGGTGATWRQWRRSTATLRRRTRTRENCQPMVSRISFFSMSLLLLLLLHSDKEGIFHILVILDVVIFYWNLRGKTFVVRKFISVFKKKNTYISKLDSSLTEGDQNFPSFPYFLIFLVDLDVSVKAGHTLPNSQSVIYYDI